jgi:hypothetical protein
MSSKDYELIWDAAVITNQRVTANREDILVCKTGTIVAMLNEPLLKQINKYVKFAQ